MKPAIKKHQLISKTILAILFIISSLHTNAQFSYLSGGARFTFEKPNDLVYFEGFNKEIDDNIEWALKKFCKTQYTITTPPQGFKPEPTGKTYIQIQSYKGHQTTFNFMVPFNGGFSTLLGGESLAFDNECLNPEKHPEEIIGADKTTSIVAYKALSYTMLMCANLKNFPRSIEPHSGTNYTVAKDERKMFAPFLARLKETTVLVPKELMDLGITEAAFAGLKIKYKIETSEQIAQRIKAGTDVKNYSHLLIIKQGYKAEADASAYIVDLENGDMLYRGWAALSQKKPVSDKIIAKLLKRTNDPFEEKEK